MTSEKEESFESETFSFSDEELSLGTTGQQEEEAEKLDLDQPGFEEEESHFTELLDDIFSPNLNESEQQISKDKNTSDADLDTFGFDEEADFFEEQSDENISPEEKILQDAGNEDFDFPGVFSMMDEDEENEEPYNPFEDSEETSVVGEMEQGKNENTEKKSDEDSLNDFLASLDINDPTSAENSGFDEKDEDEILDNELYGEPKTSLETREKQSPATKENNKAPVEMSEDTEGDSESFVTPTLGEIYAAQGQYAKAIEVFKTLIRKNPNNDWYQSKIDFLQKKLDESEE